MPTIQYKKKNDNKRSEGRVKDNNKKKDEGLDKMKKKEKNIIMKIN